MPIVEYRCEHCKRVFTDLKDAETCENSHLQVKHARSLRFVLGPYPLTVEVEFPDGMIRTYIHEDELYRK